MRIKQKKTKKNLFLRHGHVDDGLRACDVVDRGDASVHDSEVFVNNLSSQAGFDVIHDNGRLGVLSKSLPYE